MSKRKTLITAITEGLGGVGESAASAFNVDSPSSSSSNRDEVIARDKRSRTTISSILGSISEDLVCSISHELMVDPVCTLDGSTYERTEIETWFQENDTSPETNLRLDAKTLIPNKIAKNTIAKLLATGELGEKVKVDWEERKRGMDLIRAQKLFDEDKIEEAAELGHPEAQGYMAARCHGGTHGQAQDNAKSVYWAKKAAAGGDINGQFRLGFAYDEALGGLAKNYALALEWYSKAAEQGCLVSMANIGILYHNGGHGVTMNLKTSVSWFRKSAEKGDPSGQFNLGLCYYVGRGVKISLATARRWFQQSSNQNSDAAHRELGTMMMKGEGGRQDAEEAGALWKKAAAKGDEAAQRNLEMLKTIKFV